VILSVERLGGIRVRNNRESTPFSDFISNQ